MPVKTRPRISAFKACLLISVMALILLAVSAQKDDGQGDDDKDEDDDDDNGGDGDDDDDVLNEDDFPPGQEIPREKWPKRCRYFCPDSFAPVCATGQKSFESECDMNQHNCIFGKNLTIIHEGFCKDWGKKTTVRPTGSGYEEWDLGCDSRPSDEIEEGAEEEWEEGSSNRW